jgi:hypothetical protein
MTVKLSWPEMKARWALLYCVNAEPVAGFAAEELLIHQIDIANRQVLRVHVKSCRGGHRQEDGRKFPRVEFPVEFEPLLVIDGKKLPARG